jgi:hypothetical protein
MLSNDIDIILYFIKNIKNDIILYFYEKFFLFAFQMLLKNTFNDLFWKNY